MPGNSKAIRFVFVEDLRSEVVRLTRYEEANGLYSTMGGEIIRLCEVLRWSGTSRAATSFENDSLERP